MAVGLKHLKEDTKGIVGVVLLSGTYFLSNPIQGHKPKRGKIQTERAICKCSEETRCCYIGDYKEKVLQSPGEDLGYSCEEKGLWRNVQRMDVTQLKQLRKKGKSSGSN